MQSKIGNKSLLKSLGNGLGIIDPVQAPDYLNTDDVKAVVNLDSGWMAKELIYAQASNVMPAGVSRFYFEMVGLSNSGSAWIAGANALEDNTDHDSVILGFHLNLSYNAAAALGDDTKTLRFSEWRVHGRKDVTAPATYGSIWRAWSQILAVGIGTQEATFSMPSSGHSMGADPGWHLVTFPHPIVVPAGHSYGLFGEYDGITNFSSGGGGGDAITLITSVYGFKYPKGVKAPYLP